MFAFGLARAYWCGRPVISVIGLPAGDVFAGQTGYPPSLKRVARVVTGSVEKGAPSLKTVTSHWLSHWSSLLAMIAGRTPGWPLTCASMPPVTEITEITARAQIGTPARAEGNAENGRRVEGR